MEVQYKPVHKIGHESYSFDARLRDAIASVRQISNQERMQLYQKILWLCMEQVGDCCTSNTYAAYIALHDVFGFGQKRMLRVQERAREALGDAVKNYGTSCVEALRRELERRNLKTEAIIT